MENSIIKNGKKIVKGLTSETLLPILRKVLDSSEYVLEGRNDMVYCGDGYRWLSPEEERQEGDEVYFHSSTRFEKFCTSLHCTTGKRGWSNARRKVVTPVAPSIHTTTQIGAIVDFEGKEYLICRGDPCDCKTFGMKAKKDCAFLHCAFLHDRQDNTEPCKSCMKRFDSKGISITYIKAPKKKEEKKSVDYKAMYEQIKKELEDAKSVIHKMTNIGNDYVTK
jgi:hypothetical protein